MTSSNPSISFPSRADARLRCLLVLSAFISAGILLLIVLFLLRESWPALRQVGLARFVNDAGWHPLEGMFNLAPMLAATTVASIGAICLAGPLGVASAVFARFYAPVHVGMMFRLPATMPIG